MTRPKSMALSALEGTLRLDRLPVARATVASPPASGRCPRDLPKCARPFWRRLAPALVEAGLLTKLDLLALREMCLALGHAAEADADIEKRGILINGDRGAVKNPSIQLSRDYWQRAWAIAKRFGMTPQDRAALSFPAPPTPASPFPPGYYPELEAVLSQPERTQADDKKETT